MEATSWDRCGLCERPFSNDKVEDMPTPKHPELCWGCVLTLAFQERDRRRYQWDEIAKAERHLSDLHEAVKMPFKYEEPEEVRRQMTLLKEARQI
jgi:hypothetical protein